MSPLFAYCVQVFYLIPRSSETPECDIYHIIKEENNELLKKHRDCDAL